MLISSYLWVKGGEKQMRVLERTSFHLPPTTNIFSESINSMIGENCIMAEHNLKLNRKIQRKFKKFHQQIPISSIPYFFPVHLK